MNEEDRRWWAWYAQYLQSPQWKERRRLVLERDEGRCQWCREAATQVHHLSYRWVGREPLEHLAAICDECHDLMHPDKARPQVYTRATAPPDLLAELAETEEEP